MGNITIYFENKTVVFCNSGGEYDGKSIELSDGEVLTPANLLKILENTNKVYLLSGSPQESFENFAGQLVAVEAAGGVVEDPQGMVWMMRRKGRWDLPKGHIEDGETPQIAALREVEEETGLSGMELGPLITTTSHFYNMHGRWELKRTWWYRMKYMGHHIPVPQAEEGITEVRWFSGKELAVPLSATYSTIIDVFKVVYG